MKVIASGRFEDLEQIPFSQSEPISDDVLSRMSQPFERDLIKALRDFDSLEQPDTFELVAGVSLREPDAEGVWRRPYAAGDVTVSKGDMLFINAVIFLAWERQDPYLKPGARQRRLWQRLISTSFTYAFKRYEAEYAEAKEEIRIVELSRSIYSVVEESIKKAVSRLESEAADLHDQYEARLQYREALLRYSRTKTLT
jgi:hypothetical protein